MHNFEHPLLEENGLILFVDLSDPNPFLEENSLILFVDLSDRRLWKIDVLSSLFKDTSNDSKVKM